MLMVHEQPERGSRRILGAEAHQRRESRVVRKGIKEQTKVRITGWESIPNLT